VEVPDIPVREERRLKIMFTQDIINHFWNHIIFPDNLDDCWTINYCNNKDGYPVCKIYGISLRCNRVIYEMYYNINPDGYII